MGAYVVGVITQFICLAHRIAKIEGSEACSDGIGMTIEILTYAYVYVPAVDPGLIQRRAIGAIFQIALFVLTLVKFVSALRARWSNTPIITLLMRDGTWSFFLVLGSLLSLLCLSTPPT
jgi:hypothetical protein